MEDTPIDLWVGDYDNYLAEIGENGSKLYAFSPHVVLVMRAESRCVYTGNLTDSREAHEAEARGIVTHLLELARKVHELGRVEVRASHLVLEVRNGVVPMQGFFEYVGFCFFMPTVSVGPINPYSNHRQGFQPPFAAAPVGRALLRILVGLVKFKFLGSVFFQLTYTNLLFDDHYHSWFDLVVTAIFYYLFLYCNFSGFCDVAIGVGATIIPSG